MATKRIKQTGPAIQTRQQMEREVADISELTIFRDAQTAAMDQRLMEIRTEYELSLSKCQEELDAKMAGELVEKQEHNHILPGSLEEAVIALVHGQKRD
jgi:hypothetical protein